MDEEKKIELISIGLLYDMIKSLGINAVRDVIKGMINQENTKIFVVKYDGIKTQMTGSNL